MSVNKTVLEKMKRIKKMRELGKTMEEIAKEIGHTKQYVSYLNKMIEGVKMYRVELDEETQKMLEELNQDYGLESNQTIRMLIRTAHKKR